MQLQELVEQPVLQRRRVELDHRRALRRELPLHVQRDAVVGEHAQHGGLRLGLGQLEACVLELEHGVPEGLAVARVVNRLLQNGLDRRGSAHRHHQPLLRQLVHQVFEAHVLFADQVGDRHLHLIEEQLRRVLRHQADLLELAALAEAGRSIFHHDERHALGTQLGRGLDDDDDDL
ncbi:hypothetical protein SDC9_105841 [bioreactor metagenome]|uniref:Uncharacterized protein n=1 Tax=bioreactor metagenome TaxID=1076179 RepID=A0A645BBB7_9ZZZZ